MFLTLEKRDEAVRALDVAGNVWTTLIDHDINPGRRTYAAAARAMLAELKA